MQIHKRFNNILSAGTVTASLMLTGAIFAHEPLPSQAPQSSANPASPQKIRLGRQLFFDQRFSSSGSVSCNTCHNVLLSGSDNRPITYGDQGRISARGAPTLWNVAFQSVFNWDGGETSIEDVVRKSLTRPDHMGLSDAKHAARIIQQIPGYLKQFKDVFGVSKLDVSVDQFSRAVAAYIRTLVTPGAPYDAFLKGKKSALSASAQKGLEEFKTLGCIGCHSGMNLSGPKGTGNYQKFPVQPFSDFEEKYDLASDPGRYQVTKKSIDRNRWRVPTLRNIALTAPYFHNGKVTRLTEAVRVMAKVQLNKEISDQQVNDIVEFLKSLTGKFPKQELPQLPAVEGQMIRLN